MKKANELKTQEFDKIDQLSETFNQVEKQTSFYNMIFSY
jgi:hypothetical protein